MGSKIAIIGTGYIGFDQELSLSPSPFPVFPVDFIG